jgi:hypothetical protein
MQPLAIGAPSRCHGLHIGTPMAFLRLKRQRSINRAKMSRKYQFYNNENKKRILNLRTSFGICHRCPRPPRLIVAYVLIIKPSCHPPSIDWWVSSTTQLYNCEIIDNGINHQTNAFQQRCFSSVVSVAFQRFGRVTVNLVDVCCKYE